MLKTLRTNKAGGFTLVEIMIVVAIIALLASIAVPNFLRARQRSQATRILEDARILEAAKDQWAIETNAQPSATIDWSEVKKHLKPGSPLAAASPATPQDLFGRDYQGTTVDAPIRIHADTTSAFTADILGGDATKFWGGHDGAATPTP